MLYAQSTLPDWAAQALLQFPVVAIVFIAIWLILGNVDKRYTSFMDRLEALFRHFHETDVRRSEQLDETARRLKISFDEALQEIRKSNETALAEAYTRHQAELNRLKKSYDGHVRSKNSEIQRLHDLLQNRPESNRD
jgi:hypothetical protein